MSSVSSEQKRERPLSPHLQVYKLPLGAKISILHRATGVGLTALLAAFVWMLVAAATGPEAYATFVEMASTDWALLLMIAGSYGVFHHMFNGLRHLVWDTGRMFEIKQAKAADCLVLLLAVCATAGLWYWLLG